MPTNYVDDPKVVAVAAAMDSLYRTLCSNDVLRTMPDVTHDFVALHAAMATLVGDPLVERYWKAQQALILQRWPDLANPDRTLGLKPPRGPTPTIA